MGRKRESKTAVNLPPEARIDGKVSNFQISMNKYAIKPVKGSMAIATSKNVAICVRGHGKPI